MAAQCRGLTLLYDAVPPAYYVLNAATRAVTRLPRCTDVLHSSAGLGFDSSTKEFKVVRLFKELCYDEKLMNGFVHIKCETYTLGGKHGDEWRPAAGGGVLPSSFHQDAQLALANARLHKVPPVLANGSLHWLLLPIISQATSPRVAVLSFSITEETFTWVQSPPFVTSGAHLVELDGRLCIARDLRSGSPDGRRSTLEIWKLQDSTSGAWSMNYQICFSGPAARDIIEPLVVRVLGVVGNGRSGHKIIIGTSRHKVRAYDAISGTFETVLSIEDTHVGYQTEKKSPLRISLFKQSLMAVHRTNEEISLSCPVAKAVKQILLQLPAKSVIQFKAVCNQWRRLIEGDIFMNSYFARKKMEKGPKIMLVSKGSGQSCFQFTPLKKWLSEGSRTSQGSRLDTKMVCSKPCHGLNLISTVEKDYLYNPCTGFYKTNSYPGSFIHTPWRTDGCSIKESGFSVGNKNVGLGFNSLEQGHVAVVMLYQRKDYKSREYSLTCSVWHCSSDAFQEGFLPPLPVNDMPPAYVAGVLFWMSDPLLGAITQQFIVAFDIAREEFDVIHCPSRVANWCGKNHRYGFVVELQGMLCAVLSDPMANELEIRKRDRAYTICFTAWPDYSLLSNIVVPLSIDPQDGRILLGTGRKVGLYDPIDTTLQRLCALDEMPFFTSKKRHLSTASQGLRLRKNPCLASNVPRCCKKLPEKQYTLQPPSLNKCSNKWSSELNAISQTEFMPLVPMLYEESLVCYPLGLKRRLLE